MKNLILDIGNTRTKVALFENGALTQSEAFDNTDRERFYHYIKTQQPERSMLSTVKADDEELLRLLKHTGEYRRLTKSTALPILNRYGTPETLGSDRLAAVCGAWAELPNKNILVINGGTCLTIDLLNRQGEYLGGAIAPGLQMRFAALAQFTHKLPLISYDAEFDQLIGTSTEGSIRSGVQNGMIAELEGTIARYARKYNDLTVMLCGGDSPFFDRHLKNSIFAPVLRKPQLVLTGLNAILNHQYV